MNFDKCCCKYPLRTGVLVIGSIFIVLGTFHLINISVSASLFFRSNTVHHRSPAIGVAFIVISNCLLVSNGALYVHGARVLSPLCMIIGMLSTPVHYILQVIGHTLSVELKTGGLAEMMVHQYHLKRRGCNTQEEVEHVRIVVCLLLWMIYFSYGLVLTYCTLIVRSFYLQLNHDSNSRGFDSTADTPVTLSGVSRL